MSNVFAITPLTGLSDEENVKVQQMLGVIDSKQMRNALKEAYYEGKARIRNMGISIPPSLQSVETVVGWPGTAVDVLDERLDLEGFGWRNPGNDDMGVSDIFEANRLDTESGLGNLDALIYGLSFVAVGTGFDGEPDPLITVESPKHMTAIYDARTRRISAGLSRVWDHELGRASSLTLYLPNETIRASRGQSIEGWTVDHRDPHNLGRVPIARLVNRPRSGDLHGRSEITRAIMGYTDNAVRTLLGMEVAREFYSAPQRYVLGADEKAFVGADGTPKTAWEAYMGRVWAIGNGMDDAGNAVTPSVGQFPAGSMAPYTEQIKTLAQLVAAETAIPSSYLGFVTDNPASADAIRAAAARLEKRAERRITGFGAGWTEAMNLALLVRDGTPPPTGLFSRWRDAATPTKAAATDGVVKLIAAGVLPATSEVTYEQLGFDAATRARLLADNGGASDRLFEAIMAGTAPA